MLKVSVQTKGVKPEEMILRIGDKIANIERAMRELGNQTAEKMRDTISINTLRKPASSALSNAIQAHEETIGGNFTVGVGKKDVLPPYWYVVNYGVKFTGEDFIPGGGKGVRGDFGGNAPDSTYGGRAGGAGARMTYPGKFVVAAKNPIQPMNYIEKTSTWLNGYFGTFITNASKRK